MKQFSFLLILSILFFSGCNNSGEKKSVEGKLKYSDLLTISTNDGYTKVEIRTKPGEKPVATYLLIPEGNSVPEELPKEGEIIRTPVKKLIVNTAVYAYPMKELGAINTIKGIFDASFFSMPEIKRKLQSGAIVDVGNSQSPSVEKIVEMSPDGIMINLYEGMDVPQIVTSGVPYIKLADNLETSALGRAEWIKFIGLLTGTEIQADSIFKSVESNYLQLKKRASEARVRPKVLTDNMYEGVWYVPGGNSSAAGLLADAGATYPWADNIDSGSLSLSYEEVLDKGGDADIWLLKLYNCTLTSEKLKSLDVRYTQLAPYKTGKVWYSDTSVSGLFDLTAFHPDLLLADYISIFHPELATGHTPVFFKLMLSD